MNALGGDQLAVTKDNESPSRQLNYSDYLARRHCDNRLDIQLVKILSDSGYISKRGLGNSESSQMH